MLCGCWTSKGFALVAMSEVQYDASLIVSRDTLLGGGKVEPVAKAIYRERQQQHHSEISDIILTCRNYFDTSSTVANHIGRRGQLSLTRRH
jgi:hypothetical protein